MCCVGSFPHSTAMSSNAPLCKKCAYPVYNTYKTSYTPEKEKLESVIMEVTEKCTCSCQFLLLMVLCNAFSRHNVTLTMSFSQHYGLPTQSNPQCSIKTTQLKAKPHVTTNSHCIILFFISERRKKLLVKSKPSFFDRKYILFSQSSLQSRICSAV